MGKQNHCHK